MSALTTSPATSSGGSPVVPNLRRRGLIVAMIMLLMVINFADKAILGLAGKPIMTELGLTKAQFGLAGSIFFLLFGVTGILVGFLGNRVASTKVLFALA